MTTTARIEMPWLESTTAINGPCRVVGGKHPLRVLTWARRREPPGIRPKKGPLLNVALWHISCLQNRL